MKINQEFLNNIFRETGKMFERDYRAGFSQTKPKKIMAHTRQSLRSYRNDTSLDIFAKIFGTILIWRYAKLKNIPNREMFKLERSILRSFYYLLRFVPVEQKEGLTHLLSEAGPRRSIFSIGNPLGFVIELKIIEFQILDADTKKEEKDLLEFKWKRTYDQLHKQFKFRIINPLI